MSEANRTQGCHSGHWVGVCRSRWIAFLLLLASLLWLPGQIDAQSLNGPASPKVDPLGLPPVERPFKVYPSFRLLAIHNIDDEAETIEFSGVFSIEWTDPRQAFDPAVEGVEEKMYNGAYQFNELSPAWYPQVVLANAAGTDESQDVLLRVKPDGTSRLLQMVHSVARSRMDLRRYPFDSQKMLATFSVLGFDDNEVAMAVPSNSASVDLEMIQVPQWELVGLDSFVKTFPHPDDSISAESSVYTLQFDLTRRSFLMVRLVILPLVLIVIMSWSVFWMDRSSLGDRMAVSFVGILTAVSYQMMVSDVMPHISYITFMNALLSFSFLVMSATVAINLVVGAMDKRGDIHAGDRLDRLCRKVFPVVYAGLILFSAFVTFVLL